MPCIQIKTNVPVSPETAETLKSSLGQAICCLPGKTEDWLMVTLDIEDASPLAGKDLESIIP